MKVSATYNGLNTTITGIVVNGLDIYINYIDPNDGYLKTGKLSRNPLVSATVIATNAASLESGGSGSSAIANSTTTGLLSNTDWITFNNKATTATASTSTTGLLTSSDWNTFNNKATTATASTSTSGLLTSTDWNTFNNKATTATANTSTTGLLTSTDWNTFNNKATTAIASSTTTGLVTSSQYTTITNIVGNASTSANDGYLSKTDYSRFDARGGHIETMPIQNATTQQDWTTSAAFYTIFVNSWDSVVSGATFAVASVVSASTLFEIGLYTGPYSATPTKLVSGQVTVTSAGWWSAFFSSPYKLTKNTTYYVAVLKISGSCNYMASGTTSSLTMMSFSASTGLSALPATESTARAASRIFAYVNLF